MKTVIKVENISKEYRLGEMGSGTISRDLNAWWAKIKGKENPNLSIEQIRTTKNNNEFHQALSNISFEVNEGEVLGIIGKNGAGKSTLLKILSRVTTPTVGTFKVRGRIASLLEVGTGFHPDLTGRDNIYLNGAILGMKKWEIKSKFDEIVDFSGVEKFIDTPVKRYSSGMYVRLAFAVAAHLEPEILIVDEVLAVGDIAFQNKCMGKMGEVSKQGRTILFVSHNMQAMSKLCSRGILLKNGMLEADTSIEQAIRFYIEGNTEKNSIIELQLPDNKYELDGFAYKVHIEDTNENLTNEIPVGKPWQFRVFFTINKPTNHFILGVNLTSSSEVNINTSWTSPEDLQAGNYQAVFKRNDIILAPGIYSISVGLSSYERTFQYVTNIGQFQISDIIDKSLPKNVIRTNKAGLILNPMETIIIQG